MGCALYIRCALSIEKYGNTRFEVSLCDTNEDWGLLQYDPWRLISSYRWSCITWTPIIDAASSSESLETVHQSLRGLKISRKNNFLRSTGKFWGLCVTVCITVRWSFILNLPLHWEKGFSFWSSGLRQCEFWQVVSKVLVELPASIISI